MRIAVVVHRIGPYHFARLRAAGKRGQLTAVELSGADHTYRWDKVEGVDSFRRVTVFPDSDVDGEPSARVVARVWSTLDRLDPDVVVVAGWSETGFLASLAWALRRRRHTVLMSESTAFDERRRWWRELAKSRVVRLFGAALVGGTPHAEYAAGLGVRPERIFPGYDVVDNAHFAAGADAARADDAAERARLGLPARYLLASARFVPKKNLERLLIGYARYRSEGDDPLDLVLLGDGPLQGELVRLRNALGLDTAVRMPGFLQYADLPACYGLATAFVHASTSEQWGLVVNEAMAAGLPVLVSRRCGCARDLVSDGRNGVLFDPFDSEEIARAMLRLCDGGSDLPAMGRASRTVIAAWTPDLFGRNLWRAVESAVGAPQPAARRLDRALLWALARR